MTVSADVSPSVFRRALIRLKRNGCAILVSGDDDACDARQCRRFLGVAPSYRRLFVLTDGTADRDVRERLPAGIDPERDGVAVVDVGTTAVSDADSGPDLDELGAVVLDALDSLTGTETLAPGELRVCLDSAGALYDAATPTEYSRFARTVADAVRAHSGMLFFYVSDHHDASEELASVCDAIVEVRAVTGGLEHRWRLPDEGATRWVRL
jgi:hypothetical protein